jgi:hypothetical protein
MSHSHSAKDSRQWPSFMSDRYRYELASVISVASLITL